MNDMVFPEKLKYKYQVCAVIFGADKSILDIKLKDDYSFVLKSIYSKDDGLTELFQTDVSGLQRNYYSTIVDDDYKVICIEKIIEIELNLKTAREPIEKVDGIMQPSSYYSLFPFSESYPTKNVSTINCNDRDIDLLNKALERIKFPLEDRLLNSVHIFYDLSYHTEFCVSVSLLITALEMLFLNSENSKREKISKRCAVYISNSEEEITALYKKLKSSYKLRCDFIHDGDIRNIGETTVLLLRDCVRRALLKSISTQETKCCSLSGTTL